MGAWYSPQTWILQKIILWILIYIAFIQMLWLYLNLLAGEHFHLKRGASKKSQIGLTIYFEEVSGETPRCITIYHFRCINISNYNAWWWWHRRFPWLWSILVLTCVHFNWHSVENHSPFMKMDFSHTSHSVFAPWKRRGAGDGSSNTHSQNSTIGIQSIFIWTISNWRQSIFTSDFIKVLMKYLSQPLSKVNLWIFPKKLMYV